MKNNKRDMKLNIWSRKLEIQLLGAPKIYNSFAITCPHCDFINELELDFESYYPDITAGLISCEYCNGKLFIVCLFEENNANILPYTYKPPTVLVWGNNNNKSDGLPEINEIFKGRNHYDCRWCRTNN